MRYLKYLALLAILAVPAIYANAQVAIGVQIGPDYGYYNAPPVCDYGYYPYYPFACAPYGYWGPQWFVSGVFIGAGPWDHFYFRHPDLYERWGFRHFHGEAFDHDGFRGFRDRDDRFRGNFRGNPGFRGGEAFRGGDRGFHGGQAFRGGGGVRGGESFHGGGEHFRGSNSHGGGEFHGGGNFHGGESHGGGHEHGGRR